MQERRRRNIRLAAILGVIAFGFFVLIMVNQSMV